MKNETPTRPEVKVTAGPDTSNRWAFSFNTTSHIPLPPPYFYMKHVFSRFTRKRLFFKMEGGEVGQWDATDNQYS